ncbi:nascent polypeptide-associated complex protein [Candidatus Pacearchaeota archaeon]|nr:nascent polypeptide-associated complex protein [Candidatus Pacearchaeota archaeon]
MFPGFDAKKMQAMMKQLGIAQENIDASKVIIEKPDGKIIIENPSVTKIKMQGQETFQISGEISEEALISEEDIQTVIEKTHCSEEIARETLEKNNGDLAETIMELS